MKRYEPTMPKTALIVAALAMSALTLAVSVAPARLDEGTHAATAAVTPPAATEVTIIPARIEVVATREPQTMFGAVRQFFARKVQPS